MKTKLLPLIAAIMIPFAAMAADPSPTPSGGDESLKSALAETVRSITATLNDVKAQTPEFFQQYIAREIYFNDLWSVGVGLASLVFAGFAGLGLFISNNETGYERSESRCLVFWCIAVSVALAIFGPMRLQIDNRMIRIAPKVYAIEFAKSLIK